ncbi:unnamed protein product [Adineta steineri]|uniref:Protein-tyrosine-phosphatase n=1 Tax=Adineta steineri TaxID=433720 RepID=A0A815MMA1_9BILA|nr:unnamed protein product [Adineta steineri]CAF1422539.1 unnamed protein product [Adineta steineri]
MPFSQRYLDRKIDTKARAANMGGEMSLVLPHLYLGALKDRTNSTLMTKNQIKRVLCIIDVPDIIVDKEYKPTHLLNIQAADAQEQDLAQYFEKCIEFIHQARTEHENILVHCYAGISRSATVVLAYLMTIGDYDVDKAIQIVKGARGFIHPNPGFLSQLKRYQSNDVKKNWYRLTRRYQSYSFDNGDVHFVKSSLDIYWQQFEPAFIAEPVYWSTRKENSKENSAVPYERKMICTFAEQIIDNNQEQKLKRIIPTNEEKLLTSNIVDQQTEKALIIPSTTKRYQSSKVKTNSSRTMGTK